MAKQIEIAAVESLLTKLAALLTEALNKKTEALKNIFEGRLDEHEHDALKEKGDKIIKENDEFKEQIVSQKEIIQKLEQKAAENRRSI